MGRKGQEAELSSLELLNERLQLTLAFSKRYQMSTAVCYLRLQLPIEVSQHKDYELDKVLDSKILSRLKRSIRELDTVLKVNKTDFIILIANITEHECKIICDRIIRSISNPFTIKFHHISIISQMGICMYPYASEDLEKLLTIAKTEMYVAEQRGHNQLSFFKGALNQTAYRKVLIENDVRYALKKGQLHVQYQPQYSTKKRKIEGMESLIRWNHPSLGEVSPGEFISYAEEAGVSNGIFFWLFEEVCKNIAKEQNRNLKYSVNLSVNQLLLEHLLLEITTILQRYDISAAQITLEITENIEIYTVKKVNKTLHSLKEMGFTIALDDFGNGYFSFSDFLQLPIDYIKLDRDFVSSLMKNKKHKSVIQPIISMTHNLGLQLIIEGIENHNQFTEWSTMGCDIIQGYFISKPIPFLELIDSIELIEQRILAESD